MDTALERYLSLGIVPDAGRANRYLDRVVAGPDPTEADPVKLLRTILRESLPGSPDVVIPLSGGNDSRGVLGATLGILPAGSITCVTLGQADGLEWQIASEACRRTGVRHERIDPDEFVWDLDEMVELAKRAGRMGDGLPLIDSFFVFVQFAKRIGQGLPVLSGYLGDAISGKHLGSESGNANPVEAARRFIFFNVFALNGVKRAGLVEWFTAFVEDNEWRRSNFRSFTQFDLLDFGFRQAHRIRAAITGPYANCFRPYEDPRWVRFWLQQPFGERLNQAFYRRFLRSEFPDVFSEGNQPGNEGRVLIGRALGRGDPRVNKTIIPTLRRAAESFDRRKLAPIPFLPTVERLTDQPTDIGYMRARCVLSAEAHVRAGHL
jgi:hypothetical protein